MDPPARLLVLLGSNVQPALHLALAGEAIDRVFPLLAELGRCRAAAVGGSGVYSNLLLLCRVPALLAEPQSIDRYCRMLEAGVARRAGTRCPIDIDPFLIVNAGGVRTSFARTPKVLTLLGVIDPERRLGLPYWAFDPP